MNEYRTILVPFDFSEHAREALEIALDLAQRFDGAVHVLHVMATPVFGASSMDPAPMVYYSNVRDSVFASLCEVAETAEKRASRPVVASVVGGVNIAETIRAAAEEISADLIVMGTHGRTGLAHLLLGSVTERTLRSAPCPVLTVRPATPRGSATGEAPESASACLETMTEAVDRLERAGFSESFQAREGMLYALKGERSYDPERLVVQEIVRFEGESDPADSTVLFALRTPDESVRGTFVASYGASTDADCAAVVSKLETNPTRAAHVGECAARAEPVLVDQPRA